MTVKRPSPKVALPTRIIPLQLLSLPLFAVITKRILKYFLSLFLALPKMKASFAALGRLLARRGSLPLRVPA